MFPGHPQPPITSVIANAQVPAMEHKIVVVHHHLNAPTTTSQPLLPMQASTATDLGALIHALSMVQTTPTTFATHGFSTPSLPPAFMPTAPASVTATEMRGTTTATIPSLSINPALTSAIAPLDAGGGAATAGGLQNTRQLEQLIMALQLQQQQQAQTQLHLFQLASALLQQQQLQQQMPSHSAGLEQPWTAPPVIPSTPPVDTSQGFPMIAGDKRIHAFMLAALPGVSWLPLCTRPAMEGIARRIAVERDGTDPLSVEVGHRLPPIGCNDRGAPADDITHTLSKMMDDESDPSRHLHKAQRPNVAPPRATLFVGGISIDVVRDPRVLPWLAAVVCQPPVAVRKVVPHKESKKNNNNGAPHSAKLSQSAFVVVDAADVEPCRRSLHHRVLWDVSGCWISAGEGSALLEYVNTQCTWQRREAAAAAGLPRHLMTVELATSTASGNHAALPTTLNH